MLLDLLSLEQLGFVDKTGVLTSQGSVDPDVLFRRLYLGLVSSSGTNRISLGRMFAGTTAPIGVGRFQVRVTYVGFVTPAGVVVRYSARTLAGVVTTQGVVFRGASKSLSAQVPSAGVTSRQTQKSLGGAGTPLGVVTRAAKRIYSGTIGVSGSVLRRAALTFSGVISTVSLVVMRKFLPRLFEGRVDPGGQASPVRTRIIEIIIGLAATEVRSLVQSLKTKISAVLAPVGQQEVNAEVVERVSTVQSPIANLFGTLSIEVEVGQVGQITSVESRTVYVGLAPVQQEVVALGVPQDDDLMAGVGSFGQLIEVIDRPG